LKIPTIISNESPISEDVSDNLFINLAIDGGAKTIISGDSHLLKLKEFKGIEIIKIVDFLRKNESRQMYV
jgi:predicted nucleic acid-binding protein